MNKSVEAGRPGLGIGGVVFVVLLVLKIVGTISMGWFWVLTSIIWASLLGIVGIAIVIMLIALAVMIFKIIIIGLDKIFNG